MNTYYSPFNLKLHVIDLICLIPDFHYKFGLIIIIMIYWWYYGNWRRQLLLTQPAWCLIHSKYVVLMTKILTWNILSNGRDKAFPVVSKPDLQIPWVWIFLIYQFALWTQNMMFQNSYGEATSTMDMFSIKRLDACKQSLHVYLESFPERAIL